jgi:hypothetical protein
MNKDGGQRGADYSGMMTASLWMPLTAMPATNQDSMKSLQMIIIIIRLI